MNKKIILLLYDDMAVDVPRTKLQCHVVACESAMCHTSVHVHVCVCVRARVDTVGI